MLKLRSVSSKAAVPSWFWYLNATLAAADETGPAALSTSSFAAQATSFAVADPEQTGFLQHVDALKQQYADVLGLVKRGCKTKIEYLSTFVGYGPEHNLWQDDVENCEQLVKDCWASKPESERFAVVLFPPTRAHGRQ